MARAIDATIVMTDRRVLVNFNRRTALDLEFDALRRIEFDIERVAEAPPRATRVQQSQ